MKTVGYSMKAICELILKDFDIREGHWVAYVDFDENDNVASVNVRTCEPGMPDAVDASTLRHSKVTFTAATTRPSMP
jgi:hypothetical protein